MKRSFKRLALLVGLVGLCVGAAQAQNTVFYLPQVVDGSFAGGSFRTTFLAFNPNPTPVSIDLVLTNQTGAPLEVTIPGLGSGSRFSLVLPPGGGRIVPTSGTGSLETGAARITANTQAPLGISAVFTFFDGTGKLITEAGVGSSTPLSEFALPVDTTGDFNTGLALFNFNSFDVTLQLVLLRENGDEVDRSEFVLPAGHQRASFVAGEFFSGASDVRGMLRVNGSAQVAAVTLRQNESPVSFTTLPVVSQESAQTDFLLPQVADGLFEGGEFRTTFIVFNFSPARAQVSIRLSSDDGTPLEVALETLGTGSSFNLELDPGQAFFGRTGGVERLRSGAATINSSQPVGVSSIFTVLDTSRKFVTEAGVGDSPALHSFSIPVDFKANSNTGVAFFNHPPAGSGTQASVQAAEPVTLTLQLRNQQGSTVGLPVTLELEPGRHTAKFVTELIPGILSFRGTLAVTSSGEVAAVTLRQNGEPLVFTTLPVAIGAFDPAQAPPSTLLSRLVDNVDGTADRIVDVQLAGGFRLSGTVTGAAAAGTGTRPAADGPLNGGLTVRRASAVSQTGVTYGGLAGTNDERFSVPLPPGLYRLSLCYQPGSELFSGPTLTYDLPGTIQVQGDTRRDFEVPAAELFTISGTVSGLAKLPSDSGVNLVLTSTDARSQGTFSPAPDGSYSGSLPNGTYQASLSQTVATNGTLVRVRIQDLGMVTIAGADQTANFQVPDLVTLSGKVTITDNLEIPEGSRVLTSFVGTSFPLGCVFPPGGPSAEVDPFSGDYQMLVPRGAELDMAVRVPFFRGSTPDLLTYNFSRVSMDGDQTRDLSLGGLPAERRISGTITAPDGAPVPGVFVTSSDGGLTGLPQAFWLARATSDQEGKFELTIRDAAEVQLIFRPPQP